MLRTVSFTPILWTESLICAGHSEHRVVNSLEFRRAIDELLNRGLMVPLHEGGTHRLRRLAGAQLARLGHLETISKVPSPLAGEG